jgi:hypothetical protein
MARKPISDMSAWPSLSLEGNLIAPAMIARIDQRDAPEQAPEDYAVRKGLTIREEISTAFRVGQSHFDAFEKLEAPSQDATRRFVAGLFKETFGFEDLTPADAPLAMIASGRVPLVVVPPSETLDRRSPTLSVDRSRSPAFALQDYLNDTEEALWGIVTNGTHLRLMRDNASLTRPAYIEADLAQIFSTEDIASFAALWLIIHRSRFGAADTPATDCPLERWREAGSREGEAARDRLADQVQIALKVLGSGFLEANPELAAKLKSGEVNLTTWFNELLRLVYRLIFLMVAEDRNLLHPAKSQAEARALYAEGYSLAALRKQCYRAATWDKHHDRYEGIKIVFRALAHGQEALALPALGGLFAEDRLPHLENATLRNKAFMEALYRLAWLKDKTGMVPVNWRAMETEELGSVYESLLELQPQLGDDGKTLVFASEAAEQKGNQRKTTGSYYTPDSLVQALLDTALDPVLDKTEAEANDPAKALLKLSVIDPACGSGHFLLAAARRIATRLARIRAEGTPSLADFRHALRDVARCCIHGVDRNPMAVELTKVALWIETVDPGLPLGFFDAQIRCGDALLGVFDLKVLEDGIPDAAYKPLTGDDKDVAKFYDRANKDAKKGQGTFDFTGGRSDLPTAPLSAEFSDLRDLPEDTVADVEAKAKAYRSLRKQDAFLRARMGCNLYTAAFLLPKTGEVPSGDSERTVPISQDVWLAVGQGKGRKPIMENAKAATQARAFHWPLEFPDIIAGGGFDLVLGNPPWEVVQLSDTEFFANRAPDIAVLQGAKRKKAIEALATTDERLFQEYTHQKRRFEASNEFARSSDRFSLVAHGKLNTYALFSQLSSDLSGRNHWAAIIVPSGLALDQSTRLFLHEIMGTGRLQSFYEFENNGFFGAGHGHMVRFALMTLGPVAKTEKAAFIFQATEMSELLVPERKFWMSADDLRVLNPETGTAVIFRSNADAELNKRAYEKNQVFQAGKTPAKDEWQIGLATMFNTTTDSNLFTTRESLENSQVSLDGAIYTLSGERFLPFYEAKMFHQFNHRHGDYQKLALGERSHRLPALTESELNDPRREVTSFYYVSEKHVGKRLADWSWSNKWMLGWRDLADARASARSSVFCCLPTWALGDTILLMMPLNGARDAATILGIANSLPFDYFARQKIGGLKFRFFTLKQVVVPPPSKFSNEAVDFAVSRVLELTYTSHSLAPFARDLGHDGPPFAWDEDRRALLRADLDAFYARAYGLTRDELRYILDPADVKGPDYPSETFRVLKEKEIRQHGEYRTRRLVLEAWDRMEANGEFTAMGM